MKSGQDLEQNMFVSRGFKVMIVSNKLFFSWAPIEIDSNVQSDFL